MIVTIEALDAWWPPTFMPPGLGRTRLAWSTMAVASHSTRSLDLAHRRVVLGAAVRPRRRQAHVWSTPALVVPPG